MGIWDFPIFFRKKKNKEKKMIKFVFHFIF